MPPPGGAALSKGEVGGLMPTFLIPLAGEAETDMGEKRGKKRSKRIAELGETRIRPGRDPLAPCERGLLGAQVTGCWRQNCSSWRRMFWEIRLCVLGASDGFRKSQMDPHGPPRGLLSSVRNEDYNCSSPGARSSGKTETKNK